MSRLNNLQNLLFGFKIDSIYELLDLIETVCIVGGHNKLIRFIIDDEKKIATIDFLNPACVETRYQIPIDKFVNAKIEGRNRHGHRVSYVKDASVLSVKMDVIHSDDPDVDAFYHFEVDIDDAKIFMIEHFIK